jgi:phage shock protein A
MISFERMFDDWKQAWRQAVENFQREAGGGSSGAPPRIRAMERELTSVSGALGKLDDEIRRTKRDVTREREAEAVCRRREALARDVNDDETVRIASEFAQRHAERAAVLERKIAVLEDERTLLARDVDDMRATLARLAPSPATAPGVAGQGGAERGVADGAAAGSTRDDAGTHEFNRMEREARERAADERLEELKRRMRQ